MPLVYITTGLVGMYHSFDFITAKKHVHKETSVLNVTFNSFCSIQRHYLSIKNCTLLCIIVLGMSTGLQTN